MKTTIIMEIDTESLGSYTDEYVAQLWHVAQANPAAYGDKDAGELAEAVGREIIGRWLENQKPALWNHQGRDHYKKALTNNESGAEPLHDQWVRTPTPEGGC